MNVQQSTAIAPRNGSGIARMAVSYEVARKALEACDNYDECQDWADKSIAMQAYAKQVNDREMRYMATRIHARAKRRLGELLLSACPKKPGKTKRGQFSESLASVCRRIGISKVQMYACINIARVDKPVFEEVVERPKPMPSTKISKLGLQRSVVERAVNNSRKDWGAAFYEVMHSPEFSLQRIAGWMTRNPASDLGVRISADEAEKCRLYLRVIEEWVDEFDRCMPRNAQ